MQTESFYFQWRYNGHKITVLNNPFCIIIDGLFGFEKSKKILEHVISLQEYFQPVEIMYEGNMKIDETHRKNNTCYVDSLYKIDDSGWAV